MQVEIWTCKKQAPTNLSLEKDNFFLHLRKFSSAPHIKKLFFIFPLHIHLSLTDHTHSTKLVTFLFFPKANGTNTKEETEDLFTISIHSSFSFWGPHSCEIDWIVEVLHLFELVFVPDIVLGSGSCGRTCPPFYHFYQVRLRIWASVIVVFVFFILWFWVLVYDGCIHV